MRPFTTNEAEHEHIQAVAKAIGEKAPHQLGGGIEGFSFLLSDGMEIVFGFQSRTLEYQITDDEGHEIITEHMNKENATVEEEAQYILTTLKDQDAIFPPPTREQLWKIIEEAGARLEEYQEQLDELASAKAKIAELESKIKEVMSTLAGLNKKYDALAQ